MGSAVQYRHLRRGQVHESGPVQQGWDACEVVQGAVPCGQVVHGQHGVGLAAAKGCLELDDRVAALAGKTLRHGDQQMAHALGDVGPFKKRAGVLILARSLARGPGGDVGRKFRLQEGPFQNVRVGQNDFTPGFEGHD